ncbi:hypothetical protein E2I00_014992 [Balaenoptera physalus]|uniref:Uncharacterized protein n=1 Tax=Balaenoptera physalus TaxID=9770 RepID=A0A6A1Q777_BALPH|nr:hypothetical protein E2I00_014992 [Balaenoptera physalus]
MRTAPAGPVDTVGAEWVRVRGRDHRFPPFASPRDIAKNALLRWRVFIYWTFLGVFDALVFFFGAYFMFENTTVTSNGQVSTELGHVDVALGFFGDRA